jgi:hypothetical protein
MVLIDASAFWAVIDKTNWDSTFIEHKNTPRKTIKKNRIPRGY